MSISLVIYSQESDLFEGPIFDRENNLLYFVSILNCLVYCYSPETKEILSVKLGSPTSNVYLTNETKIVLAASKKGFFEVNFNDLSAEFKFQIDIPDNMRYNDGIQDARGRYLIGTMGYPEVIEGMANVYSYSNDQSKILIKNTSISNGLVFTENDKTLYFIDTPTKKVAKYNYDIETGDAEFSEYIIEFKDNGSPDGMCCDSDGMLWIAEWGGSCVSQWNPKNGQRLRQIKLPHKNVTSCCFDKDNNLYVTTAKDETSPYSSGSGLFHIKLNNSQNYDTY